MKRSLGERAFGIANILFMSLLCIVFLYPYVNQLAVSLNDGADTARGGITLFPRVFTLENYITVLTNGAFHSAIVVTVLRVILGTATGLFFTLAAAYALSKKELPGRGFFITMLIIPTFISGGLIPTFMLYKELHLINNFWVYIIPAAFSFYNMIVIRSYLYTIPASLEESAMLDGANTYQILFRIYLPLCMPVIATISLWLAVMHWNDWTTTLMFVQKQKYHTLQFILYRILKESELIMQMAVDRAMQGDTSGAGVPRVTPEATKAATLIVSTLPIVAVYPFVQKYFVKGVMLGAVKE